MNEIPGRSEIISEARSLVHDHTPVGESGSCIFYADAVCRILGSHGIRAVIQAGSLCWPRVDMETDDGEMDTHFSYLWSDTATNRVKGLSGMMPELHVWAAIPDRQEIIDLTTCHLVAQCKTKANLDWPGRKPPNHLWCTEEELPAHVIYRPDMEAIRLTIYMLGRSILEGEWLETIRGITFPWIDVKRRGVDGPLLEKHR